MITSAPVLKIADPEGNFVVSTDAWKQGICGLLIHDGNVISYKYRELKEHEKNYATHDLELSAIIHASNMWRHYLMGKKF